MTFVVSIGFIMRSTSILPYAPALLVLGTKEFKTTVKYFGLCAFLVAIPTLGLGILIDSYYHDKLVISWWNFLHANVIMGWSHHFGTEPIHAYVLKYLPGLLLVSIPFLRSSSVSQRQKSSASR